MNDEFDAMGLMRRAYEAALRNPGDHAAQSVFADAHQAHQNTFVESFDVGGISYPRTDGHKLSEREAREVISKILSDPAYSVSDLRPSVIEAAYPLQSEVQRDEIKATVRLANEINRLDWRTDTLDANSKNAIRELLRMPTLAGGYKIISQTKSAANADVLNIYRGFDADHLIPDKVLRGSLLRGQSFSLNHSFATFLQDSQNSGSQHKFVTDAQKQTRKLMRGDPKQPARNPTTGEYLQHVLEWMTHVYTTAELGVDVAVMNSGLANGNEFKRFNVKGFALAQAGFMTCTERKNVGRAVAVALLIEAREFYTAAGWTMDRELPLFHDIPSKVKQQPVPVT
ncbi:hypothetical protein AHGSH82_031440 [Aeromonas hydrophila]|uniref:hypothetical protein n=1 Tax=Aeromonas hydrophila TaxID=644 RepID=UPI00101AF525|nr:hypothetical protein [Aeromonas hydrophila]BBG85999.1 hypothetical protein AHGSH82_031440 [Aeromonas hydrophila]BBT63295.1 hypothetical protein WP8S18E02_30920 [Aeromonas hydrophila]